jgi:hypothetical protein
MNKKLKLKLKLKIKINGLFERCDYTWRMDMKIKENKKSKATFVIELAEPQRTTIEQWRSWLTKTIFWRLTSRRRRKDKPLNLSGQTIVGKCCIEWKKNQRSKRYNTARNKPLERLSRRHH